MGLMARLPLEPHPKHPRPLTEEWSLHTFPRGMQLGPLTEEWSLHTFPRGMQLGPLLLIRGIVVEVVEELRLKLRPGKGLIQALRLRGQCWTQEKQCQITL